MIRPNIHVSAGTDNRSVETLKELTVKLRGVLNAMAGREDT